MSTPQSWQPFKCQRSCSKRLPLSCSTSPQTHSSRKPSSHSSYGLGGLPTSKLTPVCDSFTPCRTSPLLSSQLEPKKAKKRQRKTHSEDSDGEAGPDEVKPKKSKKARTTPTSEPASTPSFAATPSPLPAAPILPPNKARARAWMAQHAVQPPLVTVGGELPAQIPLNVQINTESLPPENAAALFAEPFDPDSKLEYRGPFRSSLSPSYSFSGIPFSVYKTIPRDLLNEQHRLCCHVCQKTFARHEVRPLSAPLFPANHLPAGRLHHSSAPASNDHAWRLH